jgi:hypothetical protein
MEPNLRAKLGIPANLRPQQQRRLHLWLQQEGRLHLWRQQQLWLPFLLLLLEKCLFGAFLWVRSFANYSGLILVLLLGYNTKDPSVEEVY